MLTVYKYLLGTVWARQVLGDSQAEQKTAINKVLAAAFLYHEAKLMQDALHLHGIDELVCCLVTGDVHGVSQRSA